MAELKRYAQKLLDGLPKEPKTALLTIVYLKDVMEKHLGKKVKGIKVVSNDDL